MSQSLESFAAYEQEWYQVKQSINEKLNKDAKQQKGGSSQTAPLSVLASQRVYSPKLSRQNSGKLRSAESRWS